MTRSVNLVFQSLRQGWATYRYYCRYPCKSLNEIQSLAGADHGQSVLHPFRQYLASAWLCSQRPESSSVSNWGVGEPPVDEKHTERGVSPTPHSGGRTDEKEIKQTSEGQTPAPHLGKETNTREMIHALAREAEERLSHEGRTGVHKSSSQDMGESCRMMTEEEGKSVWAFGMKVTVKCPGESTGESYSLMEYSLAPGDGCQMHTHNKEDETWYVLEGGLEWKLGDKRFIASKGCFIHLPKGIPHSFYNNSTEPARMLVSCFPAGFENYLLEVGVPANSDQNAKKPNITTEDTKIAIHAGRKYGVIFNH